ncbi:unnamed protein product [Oppiella nova]|uniref:tRNA pseudouridine(55) synthase n=1 Tax=Oppiella nova TaxID=334625 RepID=A0A7R9L7X6_9ACAR|nr:unnamed protein product [Oppiella nova]CAG2158022.1 unnamed protein product [Oppiella nova]
MTPTVILIESRLDMSSKHWNSPAVIVDITPRYMEPFTTGVLCVGIGYWSTRLTALTKFWEHFLFVKEWTACVQLGAQTSHWGPDAHIVHEMPFSHISEELLKQTIQEFIGAKEQLNPPLICKEHLLLPKDGKRRTPPTVQSEPTPRLRECHSIDILSWKPPELTLRVITDGYFSVRTFVHDLGLKLSSCAHLTDLCLNRMGVITTDVCLKKYELHLKQMSEAIDKYSKLCSKDLKRFSDLKPDNRRRI